MTDTLIVWQSRPRSIAIALLVVVLVAGRAVSVINYENDPDLATAIEHDAELNHGDRAKSSQALAEKHYLAYLERAKDDFQRARVYVQLGILFNTNWDAQRGEKPDFDKAHQYFREALRIVPNAIGLPILRARAGMISPVQTTDERMRTRLEAYDWVSSITADGIRIHWLESRPNDRPNDDQVLAFLGGLKNYLQGESSNIVADAMHSSKPMSAIQSLVDAYLGTPLGLAAEAALRSNFPGTVTGRPPDNRIQIKESEATSPPISTRVPAAPIKAPRVMAADIASPVQPESRKALWFLAAGMLAIACVMALVLVVQSRQARRSASPGVSKSG